MTTPQPPSTSNAVARPSPTSSSAEPPEDRPIPSAVSRAIGGGPPAEPGPAAGSPAAAAATPLQRVHLLLRGRYRVAVMLGTLLAGAGAAAGYRFEVPQYRSTGLIRVRLALPRVMFPTEQNSAMPAYELFLNSQLAVMRSDRVINRAVQMPVWTQRKPTMSPATFESLLEPAYAKGTEYISVSFTSDNAETARSAVSAAIAAYLQVYEETDVDGKRQHDALEERKLQLTAELERLEGVVTSVSPFGATTVEQEHAFKRTELNALRSEMRQLETARMLLGAGPGEEDAGPGPEAPPPTPAEVARVDPETRRLCEEKYVREWDVRRLELLNLGPSHDRMKEAQARLEFVEAAIADRIRQLGPDLPAMLAAGAAGASTTQPSLPTASLPRLNQQLKSMKVQLDQLLQDVDALAAKAGTLKALTRQVESTRQALEATKDRMVALEVEAGVGGRLSVLREANRPVEPEKDRRLALASAGGMGGMGAGLGLVLLAGLLDRRLRYAADAEAHWGQAVPVLGVLPQLPAPRRTAAANDPLAAPAAHSLHQIRALLQIHSRSTGERVFAVTSPSAAAGKTSFVLGLGVSFAAAGSRTLLVDFDVVGGGLTDRVRDQVDHRMPRRKLGRILRHAGLLSDGELADALRTAAATRRRLGETVVRLGYATHADVDQALAAQGRLAAGLLDGLDEEPLTHCVAETGFPGLDVLPLGDGDGLNDAVRISPAAASRLLDQARRHYDVVLVDTGPVPGSVEAAVVASQVDQVLMVVNRGEHRRAADRAVEHLRGAGASVAGVVFNRACGEDEEANYSVSSSRSRRSRPHARAAFRSTASAAHS